MADRKWRKLGPHEYRLKMGPIAIEVTRWGPLEPPRDEWGFRAVIDARFGGVWIARGHHRRRGAKLARCQADAIRAVERWRDSIR